MAIAATIGERLRLAREERGIPLREISDQTRISVRYLEAIEANDYKRLPGGVYNRSFVQAYAHYIGYDEKEAVEGYVRYMREHGESGDDIPSSNPHSKVYTDVPTTRSPVLTVVLAILILAILTLVALAALHWYQRQTIGLEVVPGSNFVAVAEKERLVDADCRGGSTPWPPWIPKNEGAATECPPLQTEHDLYLCPLRMAGSFVYIGKIIQT